MRTETITINYYTFDELSEEAKEKAIENYANNTEELRNEFFYEDLQMYLKRYFPNSKLDVQYQLSYCQGDGLEIFGKMNGSDLIEYLRYDLTEDTYNGLLELLKETTFDLEPHRWGYYIQSYTDFYNELLDSDYEGCYSKAHMFEFAELAHDKLSELCKEWKTEGYERIYHYDRDDIIFEITENEDEFLENGTLA